MRSQLSPAYNRGMRKVIMGIVVALALAGPAAASGPEQAAGNPGWELKALAAATAVTGALLAEQPADVAALVDGCCIWQQPGVALVITDVWHPADENPDLWLTAERLQRFLTAQQVLRFEAPFIYPREPEEGSEGLEIEPAVYVLDSEQAAERYQRHFENLQTWIDFNPGMEFILPAAEDTHPDAAVVFIDANGPIEFYFQFAADGETKLTHLIHFDFFSA